MHGTNEQLENPGFCHDRVLRCLVTESVDANLHSSCRRLDTKQGVICLMYHVLRDSLAYQASRLKPSCPGMSSVPPGLKGWKVFLWTPICRFFQFLTRTELQTIMLSETLMLVFQSGSSPLI